MKKQDDSAAHDLRDRPVPPVKGAITTETDLRPRPEQITHTPITMGDSSTMDSWL